MAYSSPEQKSEILDNEHNCKYKFDFQKALLIVKPSKKVVSASQEFIVCTTSEYKIKKPVHRHWLFFMLDTFVEYLDSPKQL